MAGSHEVRGSNPLCSTTIFRLPFFNGSRYFLQERDGMDEQDEYRRPANEDDDGYDPYSDRPASEPQYEEDPWR